MVLLDCILLVFFKKILCNGLWGWGELRWVDEFLMCAVTACIYDLRLSQCSKLQPSVILRPDQIPSFLGRLKAIKFHLHEFT